MNALESFKIVTAEEMARIEKKAIAEGASEVAFIERAGEQIAHLTAAFIVKRELKPHVFLLVGKGNNGADAFASGRVLLDMNISVEAFHYSPLEALGSLCLEQYHAFQQKGGIIRYVKEERDIAFGQEGVLLDGLVGTGFTGKAEKELAHAITNANSSSLPILAIDMPSGLNGTTGVVESVAIRATQTIFLGLPKIGFFLNEGWNYVGELAYADFGLPERYIAEAKAEAYFVDSEQAVGTLPNIQRTRHKYETGYVIALAGSVGMEGSAQLATQACLRAGAGIVRLFHPPGMEGMICQGAVEVIKESLSSENHDRFRTEAARASAALIGPGMGRNKETRKQLKKVLSSLALQAVLDAEALHFIALYPKRKLPKHCVLTPHKREMERILNASKLDVLDIHTSCQHYADKQEVTIVLKGAPTFIFHPQTPALVITAGDPGMATAGSGDVLAGIIAALLAQQLTPREAAALGALIHGIAGEYAAEDKTSYCMIASDIIDYLPEAFHTLLKGYHET